MTDELAARTEYGPDEEAAFRIILDRASAAIRFGSVADLALAATDSARLNQHRLPTPHFDELIRMANQAGGVGLAVSHSGTVGAVLFDAGQVELERRLDDLAAGLRAINFGEIARFSIGV